MQERWADISATLGTQSRIVTHPNGRMELTDLGRAIEAEVHKAAQTRTEAADGAISDGAISDGAISDGAISDGAISDGAISDLRGRLAALQRAVDVAASAPPRPPLEAVALEAVALEAIADTCLDVFRARPGTRGARALPADSGELRHALST